ncbi:Predicted N-formylglutamate amidohydrolase [Cohaesibacter gelatinilyticus]|uniref:Predicted N-formylglutamate amidohydrolase n=2 Tax=Cohaesibacter gelatinilyticus TaxID=372072 RepID=A0A285PMZ1_9HYPH|nr:Predicted N-formylglutamate amidohydrolase [Cohaesibacter gelatinilyticus]
MPHSASNQNKMTVLQTGEPSPVTLIHAQAAGDILLICEHASNHFPKSLGSLGLNEEATRSHVAWDPGALGVSLHLSKLLDASFIHQNYSRLVYDCNRPPSAHDAMPARSEVFDIPGNHNLSQDDRDARTNAIYRPFETALADFIKARREASRPPFIITIHSFTPIYHGKKREVELGILFDQDTRLANAILRSSTDENDLIIRANEPYSPTDGVTHTLQTHALPFGLHNVMIEIRNDLIETEDQQRAMAEKLSRLFTAAIAQISAQDGSRTTGA